MFMRILQRFVHDRWVLPQVVGEALTQRQGSPFPAAVVLCSAPVQTGPAGLSPAAPQTPLESTQVFIYVICRPWPWAIKGEWWWDQGGAKAFGFIKNSRCFWCVARDENPEWYPINDPKLNEWLKHVSQPTAVVYCTPDNAAPGAE